MRYRLEFYRTASGEEPALRYIRGQIKAHRAKIGRALQYLQDAGHLARRPMAEYLGHGIYELRIGIEQHQHRILYFFHARSIIVATSGFLKKSEDVPRVEIDRARRYRADWLNGFGDL